MEFVAVALAGFVLGGWAVPLGFLLGIGPLGTFLSAAGGGLVGCWAFLLAGDRFSEWIRKRKGADAEAEQASGAASVDAGEADRDDREAQGRVRDFVDRYGVRGLGLVGPLFPGVTASVAGGLALGLDRRSLGKWLTIGIVLMYGLYVLGVALLIYVF